MNTALLGGALIGLAGIILLWSNGRIMGISGIIGGTLKPNIGPNKDTKTWRFLFIASALLGGLFIAPLGFSVLEMPVDRPLALVALGGLLVGLGTNLGNGCTSGHGICGISRLSVRSLVATCTFMAAGMATVYLLKFFGLGI